MYMTSADPISAWKVADNSFNYQLTLHFSENKSVKLKHEVKVSINQP